MASIPSKKLHTLLKERKISELHHANSVATACLFLRENSLLSRGTVERRGLLQTPQKSDREDKRYSIWFDVFVDNVDIHERARRYNEYGPVTFVFNSDLIDETLTGKIWVTKLNPTKWAGKKEHQRWFQDMGDLEAHFTKGDFDHMIVFRHSGGELPLDDYLTKIILDDPDIQTKKGIDMFSMGFGALRAAMAVSGIAVPIERRKCGSSCTCLKEYKRDLVRTRKMYDPMGGE